MIALRENFRFTDERRRAVKKARAAGLRTQRGTDLAGFHALLAAVLQRHHASPTHRLDELRMLQARFPEEIVLFEVRREDELLAGTVLYDFGRVLATIPEIQEAYLVSGDYDYYIRIAVRDTRDYERLLREKLYKIPGIRHSKSHFVLRVLKEATVPIASLA